MDLDHLARRLFHLSAPVWLVYYLVPEDVFGFGRVNLLIAAFLIIIAFEAQRLARKKVYFGMRDYEARQLSAYAWATIGLTVSFIFFPQLFVIPAVIGIGWTDPLIGEMKRRRMKWYPQIPLAVYFSITFGSLLLFSEGLGYAIPLWAMVMLAVVGSLVAITVEKPTIKKLDDDFLMMVVPLFFVSSLHWFLQYTGLI